MSNPETVLQQEIRLALGRERDLTLWRNSTGAARTQDGRMQKFGLARGSSDLIGILAPSGRMVALEVKTPAGRATDEQTMFLELVRAKGGFGAIVRSVDEARSALERARKGESQ